MESVDRPISIAIETSCRLGGLALGRGSELAETIRFDASARHATVLVSQIKNLLAGEDLKPADIDELYVSAGPGSFTGLRVGITVARTLAQAEPKVRCLPVPTPWAVAEAAREMAWEHLAVILDAREGLIHASLFIRREGMIIPDESFSPGLFTPADFLAAVRQAHRPLLLIGEGLAYHEHALKTPDVEMVDPSLEINFPSAQCVWRVGRRLAAEAKFVDYHQLLPIYVRNPYAAK